MPGLIALRRLAVISGLLLPVLEMLRRSADLAAWWLWVDDDWAGAVLLAGAWASRTGSPSGMRALTAAWGIAAGMGYYSFAGHVAHAAERDVSSLSGWTMVAAVGAIWALALYTLLACIVVDREGTRGV